MPPNELRYLDTKVLHLEAEGDSMTDAENLDARREAKPIENWTDKDQMAAWGALYKRFGQVPIPEKYQWKIEAERQALERQLNELLSWTAAQHRAYADSLDEIDGLAKRNRERDMSDVGV